MLKKFWDWYEKKYASVVYITTVLFLLQIVHLYWMTTDIVFVRLFGHAFWYPGKFWETVIALVDYTEIPAIIISSILYISHFRTGFKWKSFLFLLLINSQWIHLFWITDEIIFAQFAGTAPIIMAPWLSWIAISIDYLEIPVMIDTIGRSLGLLRPKKT